MAGIVPGIMIIFLYSAYCILAGKLGIEKAPAMKQTMKTSLLEATREQTCEIISVVSPMTLYSEGTTIVLDPLRKTTQSLLLMGPFERLSGSRTRCSSGESIYIVLPHLITLLAATLFCFAVSYAVFIRQQICSN